MTRLRLASLGRALREAGWLTGDRAVAWCRILAVLTVVLGMGWVFMAKGGLDVAGRPLGTDFLSFWAASKLALAGHPALVYDMATHAAAERAVFDGADTGYFAFFYPPLFLLICLPLALVPYGAALATWLLVTGTAYWKVMRHLLCGVPHANLMILAFPAVALDVGHGQNALLSTALFGAATLLWRDRPGLAGVAFGLIAYKPHLGLLIPVVLLASGAWLAITTAAATVCAFTLAALLAFGTGTFTAFFQSTRWAREALERDLVGAGKMQSAFAAVQLWHGPSWIAWSLQGMVTLAAAAAAVLVVRRSEDHALRGAALVAASVLASPFLLDYDLTLIAIPLAVLMRRGLRDGFQPFEKTILFAGFVLPLVSRTVAIRSGLPLGPLAVTLILGLVVQRALESEATSTAHRSLSPQAALAA